ncbi:hypothetical protein [Paenochrobactrum pullorum]|uniref:hypothetical protein n=1 Tax=Paenochrobactrum pullorum TaxID=1324351 RepID=UPI0035BBC093
MSQRDAAIHAGCPVKTASQAASRYEKDADVIAAIKRKSTAQASVKSGVNIVNSEEGQQEPVTDPLSFFERMMNDAEEAPKLRLEAAKALASFTLTKPGEVGKKVARQANAEKSASAGRFSTPRAPKLVVDNR